MDLKRDFGAKGDGVTDDTAAIQNALNAIVQAGKSPVLFIPPGTYLVTQTLNLVAANGVSIIGADPSTVTFKWGGSAGGTLLHIDGVDYGKYDRITFDGSGSANILIDQGLTSYAGGRQFDTGNEYVDDVFKNAGYGIVGGRYGLGASESTVLRDKFISLSSAGIIVKNFNALDWWVWYSDFENNAYALTNQPGAGAFHAFDNIFKGSTGADIYIGNTANFDFRDNFSLNSAHFIYEGFSGGNGASTRLQGNTVITSSGSPMVALGNMGPLVMTDNVFVVPAGTNPVSFNTVRAPDCVSIGNSFTANMLTSCNGGRLVTTGDQQVAASSVNTTPPTLPGTPPNNHRTVIDIAPGSGASAFQQAINQAATMCGQHPVVHIPYGSYGIAQTLTVSANCDIQIIGDGDHSQLNGSGGANPVIQLQGPSRAILRDFEVNPNGATGIDVANADQVGSRVFMDQFVANHSSVAGVFANGLDNTNVELHDSNFVYGNQAGTGLGVKVIGGPQAQAGNPQGGKVDLLAGAVAENYVSFQASKGANLVVRDVWYEGGGQTAFAQLSDNSTVTIEGSHDANSQNDVQASNFNGKALLLLNVPDTAISVSGTGSGSVWALGNYFGHAATTYLNNTSSGTTVDFNLGRYYDPSNGSLLIPDQKATPSESFIQSMFAQSRSTHPSTISALGSGLTDVRMYRITVQGASSGVEVDR